MDGMPSSHPLQLLVQQAQQQRDQAQSALRRAAEAAAQAQQQNEQLRSYRDDYQRRWSAQFHQGATMEILQCYRSFMQRLDQAVTMQARQADLATARQAQARTDLIESERRVAAVRKLLERRAAEHTQLQRRREQKHSDELAQRLHWQAAAATKSH